MGLYLRSRALLSQAHCPRTKSGHREAAPVSGRQLSRSASRQASHKERGPLTSGERGSYGLGRVCALPVGRFQITPERSRSVHTLASHQGI